MQSPSYRKRGRAGNRRRLVVVVAMSGGNRNGNEWQDSLFLLVWAKCFSSIIFSLFCNYADAHNPTQALPSLSHTIAFPHPTWLYTWRFFLDDRQPQRLVHAGGTSWWSVGGQCGDSLHSCRDSNFDVLPSERGSTVKNTQKPPAAKPHTTLAHEIYSWNRLFRDAAFAQCDVDSPHSHWTK